MKIKILNWEKYNPRRSDVTHPSWYKFSNSYWEDQKMYDLSHKEHCVWLYLLCQCSKQQKDCIDINPRLAKDQLKIYHRSALDKALSKLNLLKCIEYLEDDNEQKQIFIEQSRNVRVPSDKKRLEENKYIAQSSPNSNRTTVRKAKNNTLSCPGTTEVFQYFKQQYEKHRGSPYVPSYGKDQKIISEILKCLHVDDVKRRIDCFFESTDDFICKSSYSIGVFKSQIGKFQPELSWR